MRKGILAAFAVVALGMATVSAGASPMNGNPNQQTTTWRDARGMSAREREAIYRDRAAAWPRANLAASPAPTPRAAVLHRTPPNRARATVAPLNLPRPRAGVGDLRDSGRIGGVGRNDLNYRGPGAGTLNGLGNANGGTGIGSGSTGTGPDTGTNAGADIIRPIPTVGAPDVTPRR